MQPRAIRCPERIQAASGCALSRWPLPSERRVFDSALHLTGAIYKLAPAIQRCSRPVGAWNLFEIAARGATLAVKLNGTEVSRGKRRMRAARPYRAAEPSRRIGGPVSAAADQIVLGGSGIKQTAQPRLTRN